MREGEGGRVREGSRRRNPEGRIQTGRGREREGRREREGGR